MSEEYALLAKHIDPFEDLKHAEELLAKYKPTGNEDEDFAMLKSLLAQERVLDISRPIMFEKHPHGSEKANDYVFREYMVRHRISLFALKLDKKVTDKINFDGQPGSIQSSVCAMHCMNREEYPKPVKKTK